jgi:predicted outer membrane repeat protein
MPLRFNPITSQLDLVGSGGVTGPAVSTDNAIARYDGTSGSVIKNSSALVQDGGAIQTQGFVGKKEIDDAVVIPDKHYMVATGLTITTTGSIQIGSDSELVLI